ncbi:hypothetical protein [Xenorhabdus bovienii]|uniref:hypothetical protein n=1 Tax=Xenorhabdus bovienii TaxID=40576 RepID=UPI0023B291E7|nr:hypothetical protein [Xenorhabdus bovienii]MDE9553601.1 hypothetical protein [Xenorhabdus bovienii]
MWSPRIIFLPVPVQWMRRQNGHSGQNRIAGCEMPGIGWRLRVEAKAVLCLRDFA